jgi:hypothetical protein
MLHLIKPILEALMRVRLVPKHGGDWEFWVRSDDGEVLGEVSANVEWFETPNFEDRMAVLEYQVSKLLGEDQEICMHM